MARNDTDATDKDVSHHKHNPRGEWVDEQFLAAGRFEH